VNKYQIEENTDLDVREVGSSVRENQLQRLAAIKASRDNDAATAALENIEKAAASTENLLELALEATRLRATIGEISAAMEKVFGRYVATTHHVSGVYSAEFSDSSVIGELQQKTRDFENKEGRRPRAYLTKMGQDGHDRGIKVIATAFADFGFDVDIGPLFQTPKEAAKMAIESDVHLLGVSSLAAGHKVLVPALINELKNKNADNILVFVGGIIPPADYDFLYSAGVTEIFGPGTPVHESAKKILSALA
jgi:methylmalonyl-CoA mutase